MSDAFYLKVAHALSGCQLVEEQLKLYITEALELVRKCVGEKMTFRMSGDDFANASLEHLITTFKRLTKNEELVRRLSLFKDERNFLSHQGITHCLDYEGELSNPEVAQYEPRLEAIQVEAEELRKAIHVEANLFRGHLWFEDETKGT